MTGTGSGLSPQGTRYASSREREGDGRSAARRWGPRVAAVAVVIAAVAWLAPGDGSALVKLRRTLFGRGHVNWRTIRWQVFQHATRHRQPVVVYRVDPRHGDPDLLRREVLSEPAVEERGHETSWLWVEEPAAPGEEPAPPEVEVWHPAEGEPRFGPVAASELTPAELLAELQAVWEPEEE